MGEAIQVSHLDFTKTEGSGEGKYNRQWDESTDSLLSLLRQHPGGGWEVLAG